MAITADQMVAIMVARRIVIRPAVGGGWIAQLPQGGRESRLHRAPAATPPDAAELAEQALAAAEASRNETAKQRLFDILAVGKIRARSRDVTQQVDGVPVVVKVWDILRSADGSVLVAGAGSLIAAILEAERVGLSQ